MNSNFYRIMTDATADLPQSLVESLGISVIPMECLLNDKVYVYEPTCQEMTPQAYLDQMAAGASTSTSQINVFTYTSCMTPILESGEDILYIAFSSGLTGSQQSAAIAIADLKTKFPDRHIRMVDSLCASLGEGLLVYAAIQKKQAGMTLDEVADWAETARFQICQWFTVDDLKYLVRGGRLSSTAAFFGQAMRIKPVLKVDMEGHLVALNKVQGRKKSLKALVDLMAETYDSALSPIIHIAHAGCQADAEYVRNLIKERLSADVALIYYIGPIISAHTGPGALALFHFGKRS